MRTRSIRVGIVGVGNCASALVQGLTFYRKVDGISRHAGLIQPDIGGYLPEDIVICAAFDIHAGKVGKDLCDAILQEPNNTIQFSHVPPTGITVLRGPTLDGLGKYLRGKIVEADQEAVDVAQILRASNTNVLVSYLPVGAQIASEYYAEQALKAGCAYINCIPVFLASEPNWRDRFAKAKLPIIGDDIKSQVGATIVHRLLTNLFQERGVRLDRTYQLNFGGNTDFLNMLERQRLKSKKKSKTQSVNSQLREPLSDDLIHIGPSDYVPWLGDRKIAHIRMEGSGFGGTQINIDLKLDVWDSPNSAAVVIDAIRCAKLALDRGLGGAIDAPSSYLMKSPPRQLTDAEARAQLLAFFRDDHNSG